MTPKLDVLPMVCLTLAVCLAGLPTASAAADWPGPPQPFRCPAAGTTVHITREDGSRSTQHWEGSDPRDPDMCLVRTGGQQNAPHARMFGFVSTARFGTTDEIATMRSELRALLSGKQEMAKFIWRTDNQQTVQFWRLVGTETREIGDAPVKVAHFHVSLTLAANNYTLSREIWFDPANDVFVGQKFSLDYPLQTQLRGYHATRITTAEDP